MLEDAIRLGITKRKDVIQDFLKGLKQLVRPIAYGKWEKIDGGSQIRFQPAGHVLGSAYVEVEYGEERYVFSGDLGSRETPLLKDPISPERADLLVLESTYGNRLHEGRESRTKNLEEILCRTLSNRGVTIIPAFSLGRTQELLYEMNRIFERIEHDTQCTLLGKVDVIVDSPLANRLTQVYNDMQEYWDEEAHAILRVDDQPLVFENLVEIDKPGEHRGTIEYLKAKGNPAVIIGEWHVQWGKSRQLPQGIHRSRDDRYRVCRVSGGRDSRALHSGYRHGPTGRARVQDSSQDPLAERLFGSCGPGRLDSIRPRNPHKTQRNPLGSRRVRRQNRACQQAQPTWILGDIALRV